MTIEQIFSECFNIPISEVNDSIQYQGIEKWDSLNHLKFTVKLEEEYNIDLDMDDIIDMSSVKRIKEILKENYGINE